MSVSSNGKFVFHPNGNSIHVYNIHTGELVHLLQAHYDKVNAILAHPQKQVHIIQISVSVYI